MKSVYEIKRALEEAFDIPFQVQIHLGPEPGYVIRPDIAGKDYFDIAIEFRHHVRMILTFIPQQYGAPFVRRMGQKSIESKIKFSEYSKCLQREGCIVDFSVHKTVPPQKDGQRRPGIRCS